MPNITAAGTYEASTSDDWEFLAGPGKRVLLFDGNFPTSVNIKYDDDQDVERTLQNVPNFPHSATIDMAIPVKIVVTGTATFNVSDGGRG